MHISGVAVLELIRISIHAADRDFKTCYQQAEKKRNYFDKQIIPPNNEESIQTYADTDQEPDGDVWLFCWQNQRRERMKEKTEELTTEQRDIARQARNAYQRARKEAQRRTYERYWYNRAIKEAQAKEEAKDESESENTTTPNG